MNNNLTKRNFFSLKIVIFLQNVFFWSIIICTFFEFPPTFIELKTFPKLESGLNKIISLHLLVFIIMYGIYEI